MDPLKADLIVVAGGVAGLTASVAAAQAGLSVIVFEKGAIPGGAGNKGMGPLGIESRLTRQKQFGPTKDEAFEVFMNYTHWRVDANLVRTYLNKSGDTIQWLEDLGVEFVEPAAYFPGSHPTWHIVKPTSGAPGPMAAAAMVKVLVDRGKEMGVQFLFETPVQKLVKQDGRVAGVIAKNGAGEAIEAAAKAVIVATGGFGDNPEMIKKQTGYEWGTDLFSFRVPGNKGDGMRMAWEAGALATETNMELVYSMPDDTGVSGALAQAFRQPHLMVNLLGERFLRESIVPNITFTGNAISLQRDRCAFVIFDDEIKNGMKSSFDLLSVVHYVTGAPDLDTDLQTALDSGNKSVFVADSIEELANKTGIVSGTLAQTIQRYNGYCDRGYDEQFNKEHRYLRPIRKPRYYAGRFGPGAYGSLGGIKINYKAEVIGKDWNPIPGLYAAGTDACSIFGDSYVFILPGNTMGFAVNSGRIAAESAFAYIRSSSC